jgi:hypothetical protein
MFGLGSNGCFHDHHTMLEWGHGYNFASSVGHPRLNLVRLLHGLTIFLCLALDPMFIFMTGTPCLNGVTVTVFASSMGRPRSDSIELLVYDSSVHIRGTGIVI